METWKIKYQSVNQESSCGEDGTSDTFSGERKCRKELKIMCGYKSNESQFMLTETIQKQYTIVYFIQSKIENPLLSSLICNFAIQSISFYKEKEFNNGFDDTNIVMFNCFFNIICTRSQAKIWYYSKTFYFKGGILFKIDIFEQLTKRF